MSQLKLRHPDLQADSLHFDTLAGVLDLLLENTALFAAGTER